MGLPSKKQLHKHKRGARKALDTLDALEKNEDSIKQDQQIDEAALIERKKSKKESKKDQATQEIPQEVPIEESKPEEVEETPTFTNKEEVEPTLDPKRKSIDLDFDQPVEEVAENESKIVAEVTETKSDNADLQLDEESIPEENVDILEQKELEQPEKEQSQEAPVESAASDQPAQIKEEQVTPNPPPKKDTPLSEDQASPTIELQEDEDSDDVGEDTQKDKYLSFLIGDEMFAVSIQFVTEIIVMQRITEVPDTPVFIKGVINLRGKVIPVIDVRIRFGMDTREYDDRTCIVVVECNEISVGMIVDTVNEVVDIPESSVDPAPRTHSGVESSYIEGMGKIGKQVNILLNIEKVLFVEELLAKQQKLAE